MFRSVTCDRHKLPALIRLSFSHQPISRSTRFSSSVTLVESRSSALLLHSPTLIYGKVSAPKSSGMDIQPPTLTWTTAVNCFWCCNCCSWCPFSDFGQPLRMVMSRTHTLHKHTCTQARTHSQRETKGKVANQGR